MIYKDGNKKLSAFYRLMPNGLYWVVTEIYQGANLVWTAIKSCFGRGYWINEKPWINTDSWRNNL